MCKCVLGKGHFATARVVNATTADEDSVVLLNWRIEPPQRSCAETTPHWSQLGSEAPHPPSLLDGLCRPFSELAALAVLAEREKV